MDPIKVLREQFAQRMQEKAAQNGESPKSFMTEQDPTQYLNKKERGSVQEVYSTPQNELSLQGLGIANVPGAEESFSQNLQGRQALGGEAMDSATRSMYIDPESIDPRTYTEQWTSQFAENFQYGVGQLIGDYGDITQILGSAFGFNTLENGNAISRTLQEWGYGMQEGADIFEKPELQNITWGSLLNPQFWAQEGGRFAPQLAEILATIGFASLGKKAVQKGLKYAYKDELKDVLEAKTQNELRDALAKTKASGFKATTPGQYGTTKGITEVVGTGKGFRGFAMTDRGVLTERFSKIIQGVSGGVLMNQRVALANAGEIYNTYNDLSKEHLAATGEELFTQEELGEMAARTYGITSAYVGADILSWSLTFGKGFDKIKSMGLNPFKKSLSKEAQQKAAGSLFRQAASPLLKGAFRVAKKAIPEGFEETLQESWEEWAKMKSYQKVHGTLEGFQGLAEKEYVSFGNGGFWDYYTSKDAKSIKVIAGAMGAMAGGIFNARSMFNKSADESLKLYNRAENLKTVFRNGTKGKQMQEYNIRAQLAELIFDGGNAEVFGGFLDHLMKNNIINEEEFERYTDLALQSDKIFQNVSDLNMSMDKKKALMDNVILANFYNEKISDETNTSKSRIELLQNTIEDLIELEKAIKREEEILRARTKGLTEMITQSEKNIQNLQTGKNAEPVFFDVTPDLFGNETIINGDPNQGTNDEVSIDSKETRQTMEDGSFQPASKQPGKSLSAKAKELGDSIISSIFGKKKDSSVSTETNPELNPDEEIQPNLDGDGTISKNVEGAIDALNEEQGQEQEDEVEDFGSFEESFNALEEGDSVFGTMTDSSSVGSAESDQDSPTINTEEFVKQGDAFVPIEDMGKSSEPNTDTTKVQRRYSPSDLDKNNKVDRVFRKKPKSQSKPEIESKSSTKTESSKESTSEETKSGKTTKKKIKENAKKAGINLTEEEAEDMEAMFASKGRKKEQQKQRKKEAKEKAKRESEKLDFSDVDTDGDLPLGKEKRTQGKRLSPEERKKLADVSSTEKVKRKFRLRFPSFGQSKDIRFYNDESTNVINNNLMTIAQMIAVNQRMDQIFIGDPTDYKPAVYIVNDLYETYGVDAVGYTIAGAQYIQFDHWDQDDVYMHEMSHIYFQITQNTPETKKFLEYAMRNKKLVDSVKNTYWDEEQIAVVDESGEIIDIINLGSIDDVVEILDSVDEVTPEVIQEIQEMVDNAIQSKSNPDGNLKRLPMEAQFVWNEEIFTHTLEGPMSDVYGKLFNMDEKIENVRQRRSKRWWNFTKEKLTNPDPIQQEYSERDLLSSLNSNEFSEYNNIRQAILESFNDTIDLRVLDQNGKRRDFFSIEGRAKRRKKKLIKMNDTRRDINDRIKKSIESNFTAEQSSRGQDNFFKRVNVDGDIPSLIEESYDDRYDSNFDSKINSVDHSINNVLKAFATFYNKYLSVEYIENGGNDFLFMPHFDGDAMRTTLSDFARNSTNSIEFIEKIENSEIQEIQDLNRFLNRKMGPTKTKYGKKESFLNTMFFSLHNKSDIQGIQTFVDSDGKVKVENSRNNREQSKMENQIGTIHRRSVNREYAIRSKKEGISFNEKANEEFMAFVSAGNRIKNNMATRDDIYTIVNYFSPAGTNVDKIVDENRLLVRGHALKLDETIYKMLNHEKGMSIINKKSGHTPQQSLVDYGSTIDTGRVNSNGTPIRQFKPVYRDFIHALVVTNRKWTVDETVLDAARNQNPVKVTDNYMLRMVKRMEKIGKEKGQKGFIKFFSGVNTEGEGSLSNQILRFWHEKISNGLPISVNQNMGVRNDMLGSAVNFNDSTTEEDRIDHVVKFFSSLSSDGKSYVVDAGRLSDSSRSFYFEVPVTDMSSIGSIQGGRFVFNNNSKSKSAYRIYQKMYGKEDLTQEEFQKRMNVGISDLFEFINDRSEIFSKLDKMKDFFTDGKLNQKGKLAIANMEINNTINGAYFSEIFFPSYNMDIDLDKRAKSASSPTHALTDNVGVETIYFVDPGAKKGLYDGNETDGIAYMLAEEDEYGEPVPGYNDIHRIAAMGGESMGLGHALKFGGFGKEMYNETFKGKNVYDKPSVQPLNAKIVAQQPALKPLWQQMMRRRKKFIEELAERNQNLDENLLSGTENHIIWAVSATANKSHNIPEGTSVEALRLENINSAEADAIFDKWYYKDGQFDGLMGSNYGVQTVMDKAKDSSILPVQFVQSILSNADINGNIGELTEILNDITKQMSENFSQIRDTILYGSDADIRELLMNHFSMANMDPKQADLIMDGLSLSIPELSSITMNTLSNVVKRKSNKLQTPGAVAHSAPSFFEKNYGITNGGRGLQDYKLQPDGTYSPMEAVVSPDLKGSVSKRTIVRMNNDGTISGDIPGVKMKLEPVKEEVLVEKERLSPRERFILESKNAVVKSARSRGVGYHPIFDLVGGKEVQVGWYVEGDKILVSRIPGHGVQTTGVAEVVDFNASKSDSILLPKEFIKRIGGDHDGDAIFINHKGLKTHKWNQAFDKITKHWLSPEIHQEIMENIEYENEAESAVKDSKKVYGDMLKKRQVLHFSSGGRANSSDNTRGASRLIGMVANLHARLGQMRAYNVPFKSPFSIDGKRFYKFENSTERSISISSAKMENLVIDNSKYPFSADLNINSYTAGVAMVLTNLGLNLTEIGLILNNPVVKEYAKLKGNKNVWNKTVQRGDLNKKIRSKVLENYGLEVGKVTDAEVNLNTKGNLTSPQSMASILRILNITNGINEDLMKMNGIMNGHTNLDTNAFIISENLAKFKNLLNNGVLPESTDSDPEIRMTLSANSQLVIPQEFKEDPIVKNYISTAEDYIKMANKLDPTANPVMAKMHNEIVRSNAAYMDNYSKNQLRDSFQAYNAAMANAFNDLKTLDSEKYMNSLITNGDPNNIFTRVDNYIRSKTIVNKEDVRKSVPGDRATLLFSKGLNKNTFGQTKFISLNNSFYQSMAPELRDRMIAEFKEMPLKLQKDLMLYDLFTHGWNGSNTMFPLFPKEEVKRFSNKINYRNKSNPGMTVTEYDNLIKAVVAKNHGSLMYVNKVTIPNRFDIRDKKIKQKLMEDVLRNNYRIRNMVSTGSTGAFFKIQNPGGKDVIGYFPPLNDAQKLDASSQKSIENRAKRAMSYSLQNALESPNTFFYIDDSGNYIKIISANSPKNTDGKDDTKVVASSMSPKKSLSVDNALNKKDEIQGRQKKNPYLAKHKMSRDEFDIHMEYDPSVSEIKKAEFYKEYEADKKKADHIYKNQVNENTVKLFTTEELTDMYLSQNKLADGDKGYGYRNQFAYANVVDAINKELTNRHALEQEKITGRKYDGKDISPIKSWLMSNNVPSNHPAVQGLVRRIEAEYKTYLKEKKKYIDQINEATDELYQEQFNLKINSNNILNVLKTLYYSLFKDRAKFYEQLYGPLIVHEVVMNDDGSTVNNMRYKTKEEIIEGVRNGTISKAQKKFYDVTSKMTEHLKEFNLADDQSGRSNYIPHTAPALMEAYSRRGLLGVMVNSKTVDERINDVRMSFLNPVTGITEKADFSQIRNVYNILSKDKSLGSKYSIEFAKLKKRAIALAREGKNEDGSPLKLSNIEIGSALGDTFMERFSSARSNKSADFPSWDLNKAFVDYVSGTMFTNGNENFSGFKKMLPIVDGVLTQLQRDNNPNMAKYVEKIWKNYFLSGSKQKSGFYNSKTLETLGITTDDTIDYLTKASLMYWLGYKGLAIGGGVYAIGNVLVGKYKNVVNNGGKAWSKGESRFWGMDEGFSVSNFGPRKANEILKKIGFMDINVYDDVNIETKNSFEKNAASLALMPMTYSERWIQGVQFLGLLTDEEWNNLKNGGDLSTERLNILEEEVKRSQGKGYQATDQRMIQMYSWGRNMLQFSRFIPTMVYELLSPRDIDRYGREHIGTYRMHYEAIQKVVMGNWNPKKFVEYRKNLSDTERRKFDSALIGFGVLAGLATVGNTTSNELFWDSNAIFDLDKLQNKMIPPSVNMVENVIF